MLKTRSDNQTWLVSQPDHGGVAGYLAAGERLVGCPSGDHSAIEEAYTSRTSESSKAVIKINHGRKRFIRCSNSGSRLE